MTDTTYATVGDLDGRVLPGRPAPTVSATYKQDLLNAAAETLDGLTRGYRPGYEAFSASDTETRTYDDPRDGVLWIDDAVTITAVAYNGTALSAGTWTAQYRTARAQDYNRKPITALLIRNDSGAAWPGQTYGYGVGQRGVGLWTATGTFGYCTDLTRPSLVKTLTCAMAKWAMEQDGITPQQIMQAIRDPNNGFGREILSRIKAADLVRYWPMVVLYE